MVTPERSPETGGAAGAPPRDRKHESMEYVSCEWIESKLVLEQRQLKFCCIGHSGSKGYVPVCDYDGGPLPVEEIRAARQRLIAANNGDGDTLCKGCHFLQKKDWAAERRTDALIEKVYVSNFSICNLKCRYCFVYLDEFTDVSNVAGYPLLPVFKQLVEDGHLAADGEIEWGGGEPTIVKGFAEIMRMLMTTGHLQQVHTSSVRHSPELEEALRKGRVKAVTSVDAGTRETYKEVKGKDRFDVVWQNVEKYARTGGDMTVKYILRHNNSDERNVREFIGRCHGAGVKRLVLTPDFREIVQQQVREETIYAFALMVDMAERNGIPVEIRDEYLNPEQMRMVKRYIPLRWNAWRYRLNRALAALRDRLAGLAGELRRRRDAPRVEAALREADALLEQEASIVHPFQLMDDHLLELLDDHTLTPHPRLSSKLAQVVGSRVAVNGPGPTVLGVSQDAWTLDGRPGYVVVDASGSAEPVQRDLWLTCWPGARDLPVRLTISDGIDRDFVFTFKEPLRLRHPLVVPPGESRIFTVRTDKTWSSQDPADSRRLGIHITTTP
ncbi:MAG TPA: radical SAM protein [Planctomycetota bacterium]